MSFQAGDVVVCINAEINPDCQPDSRKLLRLKKGALYRVARYFPVSFGRAYWGAKPLAGLQLVGVDHSPGHGWQAWRFRKVVPADPAFIESLRVRTPGTVKRLGEMTKEARAHLTQQQLEAILKQAGAGEAFLSGGGLHATLDDLKACEAYFVKLPNGKIPASSQYEHVLMQAVYYAPR